MNAGRHIHRRISIVGRLLIIPISLLACNMPGVLTTPDPNLVNTAAAGALRTEFTRLTAEAPPLTSTDTLAPSPANTESAPAATLTIEIPQQPAQTNTPLSGSPSISASVETNCRVGPGPEYPRVGYLLPGQTSTVVGRNSDNSWWFIENPRRPGEYCWIWGQTTTVSGNITGLPVITPPPPPTLATTFQVYFYWFIDCGEPTAIFAVTNTGGEALRSAYLTIKSRLLDVTLYGPDLDNSPFMNSPNNCPSGFQDLAPGETKYLGGEVGFGLASGDKLRATIAICTGYDGSGVCQETVVDFTYP